MHPKAREAISNLTEAMDKISEHQTTYGSKENILESRVDVLQTDIENRTFVESTIEDADMAIEATNFTKSQILKQAGMSALMQANLQPQTISTLLRSI
jgi:flagellin